ncbi:UDP-glycosyltransferase 71K2-like [Prosopis cineraria]|uniref:UDP-glycosyltransferase 71K2-like n=1 Tax=Prosopis cineraria TaxID=364024 RepID=UPI00240FF705|nr:UDP-glycosyltransferase 71K2-like [Prosopis cineraria]
MADMKNSELIFIPSPGIGHLVSALEFAKRIIDHDSRISFTVLCIKFPFTSFSDSYIKSVLASQPRIRLIDLPEVDPPSRELLKSPEYYIYLFMESLLPHVKSTIQNILHMADSNPVVGLVLDFFCMSMVDVGNELGLPSYLFLTTNAGFFGTVLSLQKRQIDDVFSDSGPDLLIPGFSSLVPRGVLPNPLFSKDGGYLAFYKLAQKFTETKGIIVNSFSELEQYAFDDILKDEKIPPVYSVGPVIELKGQPNPNLDQAQHDKIMKWLEDQPPSSVVFLCFGSMGSLSPSQTRELAKGLKNSGVRFLWAMRSPPTKDNADRTLTEGFLESTQDKGMICGWAPQIEVLAHKSIAGFVSHCGWNSILESLWFGVPILTWPIYAEQQLNAFRMVREFGLAVELRLDYRTDGDLVLADEIERGIAQLMDKDSEVHKKVQEMKEKARKAVFSSGSSFASTGRLIEDIIRKNSC